MTFAMIETREAMAIVDDILALEGIDALFVGPSDLSIALFGGAKVDASAREVDEALKHVVARASAVNKPVALYAASLPPARQALLLLVYASPWLVNVVVKAFGGSTGQTLQVFEADPPTIIVPEGVSSPVTGIADAYSNFNTFKASGNPALIQADDFEAGGPFDVSGAFTPAETKVFNSATGTTYARGTIAGGGPSGSGTGSADVRLDVTRGTGTGGTPDVVRPELFGQYSIYFESDFGTTQDDAIKIPAMGVQFGWWNSASGGYWQQTTGNGGTPGTGLKVAGTGATNGNFEYQGHSARLVTGTNPKAGDDDPYYGWFGVELYCYNLDQGGPFPGGLVFPMVAIRTGQWYTFDIRVKQNSMTGSQDGLGNYATAVADGIYQVWINGYPAFSKTDYRWRRHAEFGVQGVWIDVYHGGNTPALSDMHYRVDRVSVATSYIGPAVPLPSWVPAAGAVASYTGGGSVLTNNFVSQIAPYYESFYSKRIVSDYSSAVVNPYAGDYGGLLYFGGGHAGTNDNSVIALTATDSTLTFKRIADPSPYYGIGTDTTTKDNNSNGDVSSLIDATYGDPISSVDTQKRAAANHTYGHGSVLPPSGAASYGTFFAPCTTGGPRYNSANFGSAHALSIASLTTTATNAWARASSLANTARPSPWLTTTGTCKPAMPANRMDGLSGTSTMVKRASNCSEALRRNFGQCSAPGMISDRLDIIWQPLHTPRANESLRAKKASNWSRARALNRMLLAQPSPAPSTSP